MKARIMADFLGNCPTESRDLRLPIADRQFVVGWSDFWNLNENREQ